MAIYLLEDMNYIPIYVLCTVGTMQAIFQAHQCQSTDKFKAEASDDESKMSLMSLNKLYREFSGRILG